LLHAGSIESFRINFLNIVITRYLASLDYIKALCDLLVCPDPRIVTACLRGLENFLKVGEAEKSFGNTGHVNLYAQMIDDAGGLEKIKNLRSHDDSKIYEKAVKILKSFESSNLPVPSS
jgi:hypothetical protein